MAPAPDIEVPLFETFPFPGVPNIVASWCIRTLQICTATVWVSHSCLSLDYFGWLFVFLISSFRCKAVSHRCDIEMIVSETIGGSDVAPLRLERFLKINQKNLGVMRVNNSNLSLPE